MLPPLTPTEQIQKDTQADANDPALQLLSTIWKLDHALQTASRKMSRTLGVTGPQRLALRFIGVRGKATPGELAELLHLHPSTLTGVVSRLERAGLVRRSNDPADRRKSILELTPEGRAVTKKKGLSVEGVIRDLLPLIAAGDVEATKRVLEMLSSSLLG